MFVLVLPPIGYLLGTLSLILGAGSLKLWIVLSMIATWWSRGAITMANAGHAAGDYPERTVATTIGIHLLAVFSLITLSLKSIFW